MKPYHDPEKRHEFVFLFDVTDGNPNGDPDAGNLPRVDPETMQGLVTDVCLKRKVRDYVAGVKGLNIFIQSRVALNTLIEEGGEAVGVKKGSKKPDRPDDSVRAELCRRYYDIRIFGAVLSTGGVNAGQVRGPVQVTFARSIDPIFPFDISITRIAITTQEDWEKKTTEMGRKAIVPYGLYRAHGFFNPFLAKGTGVSEEDVKLLWEALGNLFEFDRSASRGEMAVRGLWVFTHENSKGNAPAHELFGKIRVQRRYTDRPPRHFEDYEVHVEDTLPQGVILTDILREKP